MTAGNDYADDLKQELLTEMADNFFSRRRRLDEHLEAFELLRGKVAHHGLLVLARWRAFRDLLLGGEPADRFLTDLGFEPQALAGYPQPTDVHFTVSRPFALTAAHRYRRAVLAFYRDLRAEIAAYNDGGYAPDPQNTRRMRRVPGYEHLLQTAEGLNREIRDVNACQHPTDVIQFNKSLDPARLEQEHACGGIAMGDICRLDRELAFKILDPHALSAPRLPTPPPLDDIREKLAALASRLYRADPPAARAALAALTA